MTTAAAERVAESFMNGETDASGNVRSMGDAIYSYGLRLAHRVSDDDSLIGRVVLDVDLDAKQATVTTARHVNALRNVHASHPGVTVEKVEPQARDEHHPYTADELDAMTTIRAGHFADLKVDEPDARWWLSRMTAGDGETHRVHLERLIDGVWTVTGEYEPPTPPEPDTTYNGWTNYETWNVALYFIVEDNDEGLYALARKSWNYATFRQALKDAGINETPDGVSYDDADLDTDELDAAIAEM